jgi:hypothetical protein
MVKQGQSGPAINTADKDAAIELLESMATPTFWADLRGSLQDVKRGTFQGPCLVTYTGERIAVNQAANVHEPDLVVTGGRSIDGDMSPPKYS